MLKKKRSAKAIGKRFKAIRDHLRAFRKTEDPEALHRLRVEVKKLRALLLLLSDGLDSGHLPGKFKTVKELFRDAAEVRTPHVNLQLLEKHRISGAFRDAQQDALRKASARFSRNIGKYLDALRPARKFFLRNVNDLEEKYVLRMLNAQLDQLAGLFILRQPAQLHESRKRLKNILYIHGMLGTRLRSRVRIGKLYLTKLQEVIGAWHDVYDVRELLKKAKVKNAALSKKLREEAVRLEKQIFSMTEDFRRKALRRSR